MEPVLRERRPDGANGALVGSTRRVWAGLIAVALLMPVLAWPWEKPHLQAMAVLQEVSGQGVPWLARPVTTSVTRQDASFTIQTPTGMQSVRARLYVPANRPDAPAMVVLHG